MQQVLDALRSQGVAHAGGHIPISRMASIVAHLSACTVYNAHVKAKASASAPFSEHSWPMCCHAMEDVVLAPYLLPAALEFGPVAAAYFQEPPLLYSLNAFWTQPSHHPPYQDTHGWHRDGDDRKQLVMFVYGTDVLSEEDGAHLYQGGTHLIPDDRLGRPLNQPTENVHAVYGRAGTIFLADTGGLHVGLRPQHARRLLLWARWGVSDPPPSYNWDQLAPVARERLGRRYPDDPRVREAIKLVVA